jgi:hypothetical protein
MNFIAETYQLFPKKEIQLIEEKVNSFRLEYILNNPPKFSKNTFEKYLNHIQENDTLNLSIQIEENEIVTLTEKNEIDDFLTKLDKSFEYYENAELIKLSIQIDKRKNFGVRNIYHYNSFIKFCEEITIIDLLKVLSPILSNNRGINFKYLEENKPIITTKNVVFNFDTANLKEQRDLKIIRDNCHFGNFEEFPFSPDIFNPTSLKIDDNIIQQKLEILTSLFSIISIFDITSIKNNKLEYKLNGYKSFEGNVEINSTFLECSSTYYKIYDWIYSSDGNTTDKIGLVRNILTIYLAKDITQLDKNILISIKSAYKTYLKENVGRYLEIRNKIFDELSWVSQKSSEIVEKYLTNYQRSIFTFLSFFVSVFILRVLKATEFTNIFSKDATILSFAFLFISIVYLYFSRWNLNKEKDRLKRKYKNIKNRYKDLLIDKDIEKTLDNDSEFNYEISFIEQRLKGYTLLWIITLIILLFGVLTISDYLNWAIIWETTTGWFSNLKNKTPNG